MGGTREQTLTFGLATLLAVVGASDAEPPFRHFVPAEKNLPADWNQRLFDKGAQTVWRGKALDGIGMPVGGICAGQVYLRGDGTLAYWHIFNREMNTGYGRDCYQRAIPPSPVDQGFAVVLETGGKPSVRPLSKAGFPDIEFVGEYPIGRVRYRDKDAPVHVRMEAFSPFIPLNAADSALPATLFHITVTNASQEPVRARVLGWLQNAVLLDSAKSTRAVRRTRQVDSPERTLLLHGAEPARPPKPGETTRPAIVLADFEADNYGDWKVEGKAFGTGPARGTLPEQQPVSGYLGKGLVNTYLGKDVPHGTLTSPPFAIERKYLQFLVGGGNHAGRTCIELIVSGKVVRTAVGKQNERLTWHAWDVQSFAGKQAAIRIVDKESGAWGHINIDQIELTDQVRQATSGPIEQLPDYGTMALALVGPAGPALPDAEGFVFGDHAYPASETRRHALAVPAVELRPGAEHTAVFAITWHFPNHRHHGRRYAARFRDAGAVAAFLLDERDRLARETRLWHDTYYDSTLPHWLLDRIHYTVSNLATETCQWWASGRFWAWEGVGCCAGTCTHVWNYAHAHARLFPELARSAREMQDFGTGFHADGLVGFRSNNAYAADGQCGTVLKAYREHLTSADGRFLRRNWPHIKQALRYCIGQDGDGNGILEGSQHNTFDINFVGPNTFVGSLYLAALRAGEAMAEEVGERSFAAECRRLAEHGSAFTAEKMFDGEYFIQLVDLEKHPKHQYGQGCLSDQLFGQGWAHQLGLGYIYPEDKVRGALGAVWKYNWAPDIAVQTAVHRPERHFARPGEAGLFTCTWPKSPHLGRDGVRYRNEIWTGIEYQAAGHMIWEGMLAEGLSIIRGIHERYQPENHNPYNEVECGDHYARSFASWGCYIAFAGFEFHGPQGRIAFAPRWKPEDFRAAFTAAEGWGTYGQTRAGRRQESRIDLKWGRLRLAEFGVALPPAAVQPKVAAELAGKAVALKHAAVDGRLVVTFDSPLVIARGQSLRVAVTW